MTDELLWGVKAIASEIGREPRSTYHLLEAGHLPPAKKVGNRWVVSRQTLWAWLRGEVQILPSPLEPRHPPKPPKPRNPTDDWLPGRAFKALLDAGIPVTAESLSQADPEAVLKLPGFGLRSLRGMHEWLRENGVEPKPYRAPPRRSYQRRKRD